MAARCLSCGAPISWIRTPKGNYMPVNEGAVAFRDDPTGPDRIVTKKGEVKICSLLFSGKPDGTGYIPHWATCPKADKHRRQK